MSQFETETEELCRLRLDNDSLRSQLAEAQQVEQDKDEEIANLTKRASDFRKWMNCGGPPTDKTCSVDGHAIYGPYITTPDGKSTCHLHELRGMISSRDEEIGWLNKELNRLAAIISEDGECPDPLAPIEPEAPKPPCPKCGGKRFLNADGSYCNAFEGSDQDPVIPCDVCAVPAAPPAEFSPREREIFRLGLLTPIAEVMTCRFKQDSSIDEYLAIGLRPVSGI